MLGIATANAQTLTPLHRPFAEDLYDSTSLAFNSKRLDSLLDYFWAEQPAQQIARLTARIDSLLATSSLRPFNGCILISQGGKPLYARTHGHADILQQTAWARHPQFVIGSVSKQITAVLVLRAVDQGLLDLHTPIRKYLPTFAQPWADTVTAHHLLNHTSGMRTQDLPLAFRPGTKFSYSNDGYDLLGTLVATVYKKPYEDLVRALFKRCHMGHSTTPRDVAAKHLLTGFSRQPDGSLAADSTTLRSTLTAAGALISNPADLVRWNSALHAKQRLLSPQTYITMITPSSTRNHPILGDVDYGYGVQMTSGEGIYEISHGGYAPGFVTVNFYYPDEDISLVVMENLDWKDPAFKGSFSFEMEIRRLLRESGLVRPTTELE